MKQLGISENILHSIESYLIDIKKYVAITDKRFDATGPETGIAQESNSGPCNFFLYVIDLVDNVSSGPYLFADNATLLIEFIPLKDNFYILSEELNTFSDWARQWNISFNASKAEYMIIGN